MLVFALIVCEFVQCKDFSCHRTEAVQPSSCEQHCARMRWHMVDEKKRMAGKARWEGVSKSEQKALVSKAAHARWKKSDGIIVAEYTGEVTLGNFKIRCAVLQDGRRIFSERSVCDVIGHSRHPDDYARRRQEQAEGKESLPVLVSPTIRAFIPDDVAKELATPIRYQITEGFGIPARGIDATKLADICEAFLAAREAGALAPEELPKAKAAEQLMRALARVAIVALIDEATGYQVVRHREELQQLLNKYVSEEFRPWSQVFPDEFYIHLFRLRNIKMDDIRKRPSYFGHLTNDIVYNRLLPGIRERLRQVNPANQKGRRPRKHFQHFTQDVGEDHLRKHLSGVVMLMKASSSYAEFIRALDRAAPKQDVIEMKEPTAEGSSAP